MSTLEVTKCFSMARKSTKSEALLKTQHIYGCLTENQPRQKILRDCTKLWGCSERQVDTYLARAQQMIIDDCNQSRPALLAELLAGVRDIRQEAAKRGQLQTSLNAVRLMAELTRLTD